MSSSSPPAAPQVPSSIKRSRPDDDTDPEPKRQKTDEKPEFVRFGRYVYRRSHMIGANVEYRVIYTVHLYFSEPQVVHAGAKKTSYSANNKEEADAWLEELTALMNGSMMSQREVAK